MTIQEYFDMAYNYYETGEYEKALEFYNKISKRKQSDDCILNIGLCYLALDDYVSAMKTFKKLAKLCPNWHRPLISIGIIYSHYKKHKIALRYYQKAVEINPKSEEAYCHIGNYYYRTGDFNLAKEYYEMALGIDSEFSEAHHGLGDCLFKLRVFEKAIEELELAQKYDSEDYYAITAIGIIWGELKRYDKALEKFMECESLIPNYTFNKYLIALTYYKKKNLDDALGWVNMVLNLEPNNDDAKKLHNEIIHYKNIDNN